MYLMMDHEVSDLEINLAQQLLKEQFTKIKWVEIYTIAGERTSPYKGRITE